MKILLGCVLLAVPVGWILYGVARDNWRGWRQAMKEFLYGSIGMACFIGGIYLLSVTV